MASAAVRLRGLAVCALLLLLLRWGADCRWGVALAAGGWRGEHGRVLADSGCYEERYRLTGRAAVGLAAGLGGAGAGMIWGTPGLSAVSVILAVPAVVAAGTMVLAMPGVIAVARRRVAFRADVAGIMLGTVPDSLPALRCAAVLVPWPDVEKIVLHLAGPGARGGDGQVRYVAVWRREGTADLLVPARPARGQEMRPALAPGAHRLMRPVSGWRLDREQFAAVTAALAPAVPIVEASTGDASQAALPADRNRQIPSSSAF